MHTDREKNLAALINNVAEFAETLGEAVAKNALPTHIVRRGSAKGKVLALDVVKRKSHLEVTVGKIAQAVVLSVVVLAANLFAVFVIITIIHRTKNAPPITNAQAASAKEKEAATADAKHYNRTETLVIKTLPTIALRGAV